MMILMFLLVMQPNWSLEITAAETPCVDCADCQLGEICVDEPSTAQRICRKPCSWPELRLEMDSTEDVNTDDSPIRRYRLKITNWRMLPDYLFEVALDLPPCGANMDASRSWVSIYNSTTGDMLNLFCDFRSTESLMDLWFVFPVSEEPPRIVQIKIDDRRTGNVYCSSKVRIPQL